MKSFSLIIEALTNLKRTFAGTEPQVAQYGSLDPEQVVAAAFGPMPAGAELLTSEAQRQCCSAALLSQPIELILADRGYGKQVHQN